jgi:hypothetical protein
MRRTAGVTLGAMLLSLLVMVPSGSHARPGPSGPSFQADFCTTMPGGDPVQVLPTQPSSNPNAIEHCNDCAGCAGVSVAAPAPVAPWLAIVVDTIVGTLLPAPAITSVDGIVSRPRGPPLPA